jgi:hypothetical protein
MVLCTFCFFCLLFFFKLYTAMIFSCTLSTRRASTKKETAEQEGGNEAILVEMEIFQARRLYCP